ncbi:MAG: FMN-binding protein [Clostridiales bacterium]|nr:FMN-binding protein [Clostridiales bacterium]
MRIDKLDKKQILIPAAALVAICLVATLLLAITNKITQPKIEQLNIITEQETKLKVFENATAFSDAKKYNLDGVEYTYYDALDEDSNVIGTVVVSASKGYGGDVKIMTGVDADGKVTGVEILDINETAGLGMNAKGEDFRKQFIGKSEKISVIKNKSAEGNEIVALTGATITSKAVTNAVNIALSVQKGV